MGLHSCKIVTGLFFLSFVATTGGSMAIADPPMSAVSSSTTDSRIAQLHLEIYEKALDGIPVTCGEDCPDYFTTQASWVKSWACIVSACGAGGGNKPTDCLKYFIKKKVDSSKRELGDKLLCEMARSPGPATIQALITGLSPSGAKGEGFIEGAAYVYALKGNTAACQAEIKNYVGPYGPGWNVRWYEDLSGCSILSKKRTRQEEESDFSAWFAESCSQIGDPEILNACQATGAPLPDPTAPSGKNA